MDDPEIVYVYNYFLTVKMRDPRVKIMSTAKRIMQFIDVENKGQKEITPNETTMVNGCIFILTLHQYFFFFLILSLPLFHFCLEIFGTDRRGWIFSTKIQLLGSIVAMDSAQLASKSLIIFPQPY